MNLAVADGAMFDMVNALLRAHRPGQCAVCDKPLALVAAWTVVLMPDSRTFVTASCPSCAVLSDAPSEEGAD